MSNKNKSNKKDDPDNKVSKLPAVVTLAFKSVKLKDRKGMVVYQQKKDETGKMIDDMDNPEFERNDITTMLLFSNTIDMTKVDNTEERHLYMIKEKVLERWKAADWNCKIEFSVQEAAFLQKLLETIKDKARQGTIFTPYHSPTKFSLIDQIKGE